MALCTCCTSARKSSRNSTLVNTMSAKTRFSRVNERLARLDVLESSPSIHLERRSDRIHKVGFTDAPLFEVEQPWAADDGWDVRSIASGRGVESQSFVGEEVGEAFASWRTGSRVASGSAVLHYLPAGSYLLVRSGLTPAQGEWLDIGNDCVKATPSMRDLVRNGPVDAVLVGAPLHQPPRLDVPLIGIPILNHSGVSFAAGSDAPHQHGIVFLPFALGDGVTRSGTGDLILVIPADGELIIDNLGTFDADDERESRHRWKEEFLPAFAESCSSCPTGPNPV
jgi:hypothetical protein